MTSASSTSRPAVRSASSIRPGWSRDFFTIFSGGMSSTPTSEERISCLSVVRYHRQGRRPFRSSTAPTVSPSENTMAAGPSQGSIMVA